ncbi:MAG: hypothetical protein R2827_15475 [Bdellovibrionales bacterium]
MIKSAVSLTEPGGGTGQSIQAILILPSKREKDQSLCEPSRGWNVSIVKRPSAIANWYLPGILSGMWFTFTTMIRNILNKDKENDLTKNYPEEMYEYSPRFEGIMSSR